jgi:hypothetical protein
MIIFKIYYLKILKNLILNLFKMLLNVSKIAAKNNSKKIRVTQKS